MILSIPRLATLLTIAIAVVISAATPVMAQARRGNSSDSVTACSRYGKGCVTGAVRQGRNEQEVRMPGGTWIGCKRDCRETLREETLDFFETLRDRAPARNR